jgi:signal transduction histidine kinase
MSLEGVSARLGESESGRRVSGAVDALDETIKEIRAAIFSLQERPGDDDDDNLRGRILAVTDEAEAGLGFAPALRMAGRLSDVPVDAAEHLLGVLREALSNAARHAGASRVDVTVDAGQALALTVRDNGIGIPGTGRRSGLANLASRAAALGGTLQVGAAPGGGTELAWRVPLPG